MTEFVKNDIKYTVNTEHSDQGMTYINLPTQMIYASNNPHMVQIQLPFQVIEAVYSAELIRKAVDGPSPIVNMELHTNVYIDINL